METCCDSELLRAAWRRLGTASEWGSIAGSRAQLTETAYARLLAAQPLFEGAAMVYGPTPHPLLPDSRAIAEVLFPSRV